MGTCGPHMGAHGPHVGWNFSTNFLELGAQ
jgi:hypothetical protein